MEPESHFECWNLQASELDLAGIGFLDALLHDWNSSSPRSLVIYAQVPHDRFSRRFMFLEECSQFTLGGLVCGYEGCFLWVDLQSQLDQPIPQVPVGGNCVFGCLQRGSTGGVKSHIVYPAGKVDGWMGLLPRL